MGDTETRGCLIPALRSLRQSTELRVRITETRFLTQDIPASPLLRVRLPRVHFLRPVR